MRIGALDLCSIDGSLTRVPDTPGNRETFGSAGTADDSSPCPQLRELRLSHASTRATLGVVTGPSGAAAGGSRDKGEAEQVLLDKALRECPHLFTPDRIWVMDRNFPGAPRIQRLPATGTHVLIRVKDDITLHRAGDFAPDGSYLAEISGGGVTLTVRVIEYTVTVAGADAPELFALITDLTDHDTYPAQVLAAAYHWRWIGSETCLKEGQVRGQRRRAIHRADAPLAVPGPDRPGARRLGHRHRADPRGRPAPPRRSRSRRARASGPGSPSTPARSPSPPSAAPSSPPPGPARRPPACPPQLTAAQPRRDPGRPGPPPNHRRPRPAP